MSGREKKHTGRRPGESQTRTELLEIAARQFAERGYQGTSLRAITSEAGVDPTLVRHFFGDKQGLFREAILQHVGLRDAILTSVGEADTDVASHLVGAYLDIWETEPSSSTMRALFRTALESDESRDYLQEVILEELPRGAQMLPGSGDPDGMALVAAHLLGICVVRYVLKLEPLAGMDRDDLVASLAPLVEQELASGRPAREPRSEHPKGDLMKPSKSAQA